jgi:hypothetical protein
MAREAPQETGARTLLAIEETALKEARMETAVIGLRSHAISDDGSTVTLCFESKDGTEAKLSMPADYLRGIVAALQTAQRAAQAKRKPSLEQLSFVQPKTWAVGAHPLHDQVLLVFDSGTDMETGFALEPKTATDIAHHFGEKANLISRRPSRSKS